jgi:reticulon-4-interacting protein 1, mitochondrial
VHVIAVLDGTVIIERPAAEVFDYICDMENYVEWFPGIVQMRSADTLPPGTEGKIYDEIARLPDGREEGITVKVVQVVKGSRLSIEASLEPALPKFDYVVESINAGSTSFYWRCSARNTSFKSRAFLVMMRLVLRPRLKAALGNLKARLERTPDASMDAWVIRRFGAAKDVLQENIQCARPAPRSGEVLVRVRATSINAIDIRRRAGYGRKLLKLKKAVGFPMTLGNDFAGEVVGLGEGVTQWKKGDRVFGAKDHSIDGTHAQFCRVPQINVAKIPRDMRFTDAASLPYVFLTAWSALVGEAGLTASTAANKKIFIQGGGTGVGTASIQLCKAWGAHVAVSCGPGSKAMVLAAGADVVIDYSREDYAQTLSGYDIALCCASLDEEPRMLSILKKNEGAVFVSIVHPTLELTDKHGVIPGLIKVAREKKRRVQQAQLAGIRYAWCLMKNDPVALAALVELCAAGRICAHVGKEFSFAAMSAAHLAAEAGHAGGKIVISM